MLDLCYAQWELNTIMLNDKFIKIKNSKFVKNFWWYSLLYESLVTT